LRSDRDHTATHLEEVIVMSVYKLDHEFPVASSTAKSHTLPSRLYCDPSVFAYEQRQLFGASWQYVGHVSEIKLPGDYFTTEVAGESLLVVRQQDGDIRSFYNVCQHRASRIESGRGHKKVFTCPYHAWTYNLDGRLHRAPNFVGVEDFDAANCSLSQVKTEVHNGLIFVNLDPQAQPLLSVFGEMFEKMEAFDIGSLVVARSVENVVACNWKVVIDNFLECDHCPIVHPGFTSTLDLDNYEITTFSNYSYQGVPLRNAAGELDFSGNGARYYYMFPSTWFSMNPGPLNLSVNRTIPIDEHTTKLIYTTLLLTEEVDEEQKKLLAFIDQVREEDFVVCENVQKGISSRGYSQGRFSLTEKCVHHFHLLMQEALSGVL
jgi:phenylpropionate dioxygenase-like ring-hydroxylating dioxygenase large terminal subunit